MRIVSFNQALLVDAEVYVALRIASWKSREGGVELASEVVGWPDVSNSTSVLIGWRAGDQYAG